MKGRTIKTSFTIASLGVLLAFSCVAYIVHADNLTPQQRFQALQGAQPSQRAATGKPIPIDRVATATRARLASSSARVQAVKNRIAEHRAALDAKRQARVATLASNVTARLNAVIARLTQIHGRFETRIQILKNQGIDTTAAEAKLATASSSIATAKQAIATIGQNVLDVTSTSSPRAAWATARTKFEGIHTDLKDARQAMIDALASLKTAVQDASSTQGVSQAVRQNTMRPAPASSTAPAN